MARPWQTLDRFDTRDGTIELRQRADDDFLICLGGRVLMNSRASRSEEVLAERACTTVAGRERPRVLVGGLGMGLTLRSALEALPASAEVVVAELHASIERWCRGALAPLSADAVSDPRVSVVVGDVADVIARAAAKGGDERFDAIVLDLYEGPHAKTDARADPFYGDAAIERTRKALRRSGVFAIWSEDPDEAFMKRLARGGFRVEILRPGRGGRRHCVFLARLP